MKIKLSTTIDTTSYRDECRVLFFNSALVSSIDKHPVCIHSMRRVCEREHESSSARIAFGMARMHAQVDKIYHITT